MSHNLEEDNNNNNKITKTMKLKMRTMHVVATWKYDALNNDCGICHRNLMDSVPIFITDDNDKITNKKYSKDVNIGTCKHGYHTYCMDNYFLMHESKSNICPICDSVWTTDKQVSTAICTYS